MQMEPRKGAESFGKPRTVLLLDPELDDLNSLIRYLLYSDQFETEGLIYQSSFVHWKGDGKGTLFHGKSEAEQLGVGPVAGWRWDENTRFIEEAVEVYARVYPNLIMHSAGYPHPDVLRSRIYVGNVEFPGDMSKDTPGSNRIKSLMFDDDPGPLYLLSGAGQSTIGRALKSIEEDFRWSQSSAGRGIDSTGRKLLGCPPGSEGAAQGQSQGPGRRQRNRPLVEVRRSGYVSGLRQARSGFGRTGRQALRCAAG